ncbi:MAG: hypothetical protein IJ418_08200 [Clostridia bacterium]|nr:hypothetical protein [Clostridia bacterium]
MRISFEKAVEVVTHADPAMVESIQAGIQTLETYGGKAPAISAAVDYLKAALICKAEDVIADHFITFAEQTATV